MKTYQSILQLTEHFKNEAVCRKHLEQLRWDGKPVCPECENKKVYVIDKGRRYKCANNQCYKRFSAKYGTIFENSPIPLRTWFIAIYLFTSDKKGYSSYQFDEYLDVTQDTAWFMAHRIREILRDEEPGLMTGEIEVDEAYFGGKETNRPLSKRLKDGRSSKDKTTVFGMVQRGGKVSVKSVKNSRSNTLQPLIRKNVEIGSTVYSDEHVGYIGLENDFNRGAVKHWKQEYVRGSIHTNTIEGYWSQMKRGIDGTYHHVSPKHLDRYGDEFSFRYNTRDFTIEERFNLAISNSIGRRLTREGLVGQA